MQQVTEYRAQYKRLEQFLHQELGTEFPNVFDRYYSIIADNEWTNDTIQRLNCEEDEETALDELTEMNTHPDRRYMAAGYGLALLRARGRIPEHITEITVDVNW